jgi:hypothetical protein
LMKWGEFSIEKKIPQKEGCWVTFN